MLFSILTKSSSQAFQRKKKEGKRKGKKRERKKERERERRREEERKEERRETGEKKEREVPAKCRVFPGGTRAL